MAQIAANLQRIKNGQRRYAITPRVPAGFIQPDQLQKYIDVANEFGAVLKLTGSQRFIYVFCFQIRNHNALAASQFKNRAELIRYVDIFL